LSIEIGQEIQIKVPVENGAFSLPQRSRRRTLNLRWFEETSYLIVFFGVSLCLIWKMKWRMCVATLKRSAYLSGLAFLGSGLVSHD